MFSILISFNTIRKMMLVDRPISTSILRSKTFTTFEEITKTSSCKPYNLHTSWLQNVKDCSYSGSKALYSGITEFTLQMWVDVVDIVKSLISNPLDIVFKICGGGVSSPFPLSNTVFPHFERNSFKCPCFNSWAILAFNCRQSVV